MRWGTFYIAAASGGNGGAGVDLYSGMEYVYTVYKEKSFTKAAKKLFIAQPSLSARIKHIEEKMCIRDRLGGGQRGSAGKTAAG